MRKRCKNILNFCYLKKKTKKFRVEITYNCKNGHNQISCERIIRYQYKIFLLLRKFTYELNIENEELHLKVLEAKKKRREELSDTWKKKCHQYLKMMDVASYIEGILREEMIKNQ